MSKVETKSGIPIPSRGKYKWETLKVGQHKDFDFDKSNLRSVRASASRYAKSRGWKIVTRTVTVKRKLVLRVWRES